MYESVPASPVPPSSIELSALVGTFACMDTTADDAELIERIMAFEKVKAAAAAAQARMTAAFAASQRRAQVESGVRAARVGQGISAQVALARRESPARSARYTGWATVLVGELPRTFAALERGETTEWRAMLVARETIWLSREDRATVDTELADRLPGLGDRHVEAEAKKLAYRLDPHGFVARSRTAASGRRVSMRPAPDTMVRLTALLPAAQGAAAYGALSRAADTARAAGDERGRGQVMADTFVERVTGQTTATEVPIHIDLVMTDDALFGEGAGAAATRRNAAGAHGADGSASADGSEGAPRDEPAQLLGFGPVPAGLARDLIRTTKAEVLIRRLYRNPRTGQLAAMDSRSRIFPRRIRHAIIVRDQLCRTPWCGAPIRHADHVRSAALGGQTTLGNGQGLCEACNYAKQLPGWSTAAGPSGSDESVTTTTPTGHAYTSEPPGLPGARRQPARPTAAAAQAAQRVLLENDGRTRYQERMSGTPWHVVHYRPAA